MDANKYEKKYDAQQTSVLTELRKLAGLNQKDAAGFFQVRRETISDWENGNVAPRHDRRSDFIDYLLNKLGLLNKRQKFLQVWDDVLVGQWEWRPLDENELNELFPTDNVNIAGDSDSMVNKRSNKWPLLVGGAVVVLVVILGASFFGDPEPVGVFDIVSSTDGTYQLDGESIQEESIVYTDRNFFFVEVPPTLEGSSYILTANGDKRQGSNGEEFELKFQINKAATICIGYDRRFSVEARPSWLNQYELLDGGITELKFSPPSGDFTTTLHLYCADHPSGEVVLGPNMTSLAEDIDNKTMYTVLIKSSD